MLSSLDAESFLSCLRRFISRRGPPVRIYSDNGGCFVSGEKELRKAFIFHTKNTLRQFSTPHSIEWVFIPPKSPNFSGVWERVVGVIKRVFKAIMPHTDKMTDEVLTTVFCEVEAIVNGRPLTKLSSDPKDFTPLTPNMLLTLRQHEIPSDIGSASDAYRSRYKYIQFLSKMFWQRWIKYYLPSLNVRSKWRTKTRNIRIGELVLVCETGLPRGVWPLALVEQVFTSKDGNVRSVLLRTKVNTLHRPITQIVPLELDTIE